MENRQKCNYIKLSQEYAYELLIENNCSSLPTNIELISKNYNFMKYHTYSEVAKVYDVSVETIIAAYGNIGFIGYAPKKQEYHIVINMNVNSTSYIKAIALSIAYVDLCIAKKYPGEYISLHDNDKYIYEYSRCLLAPDIILHKCGINSSEDIMKHTLLSFRDAYYKEQKLKKTFSLRFIINQLSFIEKKMITQYKEFINMLKEKKNI